MAQDQCNALFEEKNKKREYGKRRYWNMFEEDKHKLKEYGRKPGKIVGRRQTENERIHERIQKNLF